MQNIKTICKTCSITKKIWSFRPGDYDWSCERRYILIALLRRVLTNSDDFESFHAWRAGYCFMRFLRRNPSKSATGPEDADPIWLTENFVNAARTYFLNILNTVQIKFESLTWIKCNLIIGVQIFYLTLLLVFGFGS